MMDKIATLKSFTDMAQKLKAGAPDVQWPANYWIQITNVFGDGSVMIQVPYEGTLFVFYEGQQVLVFEVWHQGGTVTPVNYGENNIAVGPYDALVYQLSDPSTDLIKFAYQMV